MSSTSSNATRRQPQQDRAARRVTAFLEAAETEFARAGFESATMTAVAESAGSSIGALYTYFPDKRTLALALLDIYAGQIQAHWAPLFDEVENIPVQQFADRFLDRFLDFVRDHPAYLQLLTAPIRLRREPAAKRAFRTTLINALQRRCPRLSAEEALLHANVMLQIVKGMMQMYADAPAPGKDAVIHEFKAVLGAYTKRIFAAPVMAIR